MEKRKEILRLWTIQLINAWEKLQKLGILRANTHYADKNFIRAYKWMAKKMEARLGFRPSQNSLPLWAWYQWEGERKRKPDLCYKGHLFKGKRGVRIEFDIEADKVVLSDFELWHYVLNYWYLPATKEDGEAFEVELSKKGLSFYETKPLPNTNYHERIVKSWEHIFDITCSDDLSAFPKNKKSIQAGFWELRIENVTHIHVFTSR